VVAGRLPATDRAVPRHHTKAGSAMIAARLGKPPDFIDPDFIHPNFINADFNDPDFTY